MTRGNTGAGARRPGRQVIIDAAVRCFYEHGYDGSSVRDITQEAGVTAAALYHYYTSKQDLLMEIITRFMANSIERTEEALRRAGPDPVARLFAAAQSHVLWNASDVASSFIVNSEIRSLDDANRERHIAQRDTLQRMFDECVQDGCDQGVFAAPWPREASRAVVVMCTFVARWYRPSGPLSPDEIAWRYGHMALSLVGASRGPQFEAPTYGGV
ncbi:TetR/AcrR family transcriptional regulator [Streptomyces antnestii]|uniref:TetR/AcrR family transcriptional regulator n=1 Tax=Streptomyces antnestii TaxID=2494256 RepID=UPI00167C0C5D|nr:TetR/AcrR family transcriptional regulator [Streptomyces sp. San01]